MTNKTVLSDEAKTQMVSDWLSKPSIRLLTDLVSDAEQAVLQSPEIQQLRKDADDLRWLKEKGLFSSPKAKQWSTIRIVYRDPFEANDLTEAIQEVRRQRPEVEQKP